MRGFSANHILWELTQERQKPAEVIGNFLFGNIEVSHEMLPIPSGLGAAKFPPKMGKSGTQNVDPTEGIFNDNFW